jgi:lipoate-protein ligase A
MATGDYADITSVTRTGFAVVFRNSGGTAVSRQFHYTATGYGKEIL